MAENAGSGEKAPRVDFSEFPAASYEEWKEAATVALKGGVFEKSMFTKTYEGITLEPLYTMEHVKDLKTGHLYPSEGSMLRGSTASEYICRPWLIAQPARECEPTDANEVARGEIDRGATSAAFALSLGTLSGSEDDDVTGVSVSSLDDVKAMIKGIDTSKHELYAYCGHSAAPMIAYVAEAVKENGGDVSKLHGCLGADPIGYLAAAGSMPNGFDEAMDEMAATISWTEKNAPALRTVLISGDVYHNAGANAAQEVACAMASAIEMIRKMDERGICVETFSRHLRFEFSIGANFFMEIAKIRAARVVWAKIAESFGGEEASQRSNIFGRTSFFTKSVYDPYVNMLRTSEEAFAAVIGGVDGLTVGCFDEAVRRADDFSRRIARNAQIMLQEEFHFTQPADPAGGSWYLETLTHQLAEKIWSELQTIETDGGIIKSLTSGRPQAAIKAVLAERFKNLASRRDRAVGTNMYANTIEAPLEPRPFDEAAARSKRAKAVDSFKSSRKDPSSELKALASAKGDGMIDAVIAAAKAGALLEEVRAALPKGTSPEAIEPLACHRWTEQYEAARHTTEAFKAKTGGSYRVFLANMGPIPQHKARADFITGFMEVANFEVLKNDGFKTPEECADAAAAAGADMAVICSTDKAYPEIVPPVAKLLKAKCPKMKVCLAGAPAEEFKQSYIDAGVDDFIHVKTNCLEFLTSLQKEKGMN